jgi:hypothetical protein
LSPTVGGWEVDLELNSDMSIRHRYSAVAI